MAAARCPLRVPRLAAAFNRQQHSTLVANSQRTYRLPLTSLQLSNSQTRPKLTLPLLCFSRSARSGSQMCSSASPSSRNTARDVLKSPPGTIARQRLCAAALCLCLCLCCLSKHMLVSLSTLYTVALALSRSPALLRSSRARAG